MSSFWHVNQWLHRQNFVVHNFWDSLYSGLLILRQPRRETNFHGPVVWLYAQRRHLAVHSFEVICVVDRCLSIVVIQSCVVCSGDYLLRLWISWFCLAWRLIIILYTWSVNYLQLADLVLLIRHLYLWYNYLWLEKVRMLLVFKFLIRRLCPQNAFVICCFYPYLLSRLTAWLYQLLVQRAFHLQFVNVYQRS